MRFTNDSFTLYRLLLIELQLSLIFAVSSVTFRNTECSFNEKHISNLSVVIANNTLNVELNVVRQLVDGFKAVLDFQLRLSNSEKYQSLFSHNVDICSMVRSLRSSILKKWFSSLLKYGNFMDNCPVPVGHYYLKGWRLETQLIPAYLYPGDYRILGHGFYGKYRTKKEDFIGHCDVYVTLV